MTRSLPTTPPVNINYYYYWSLTLIWTFWTFAPPPPPRWIPSPPPPLRTHRTRHYFWLTTTSVWLKSLFLIYIPLLPIPFGTQYFYSHTFLLFFLFFEKIKRCYVHNIFITNYQWSVVIGSNLNLTLRLLFCPNNNNLSLKICCKNIVDISFLKSFHVDLAMWCC